MTGPGQAKGPHRRPRPTAVRPHLWRAAAFAIALPLAAWALGSAPAAAQPPNPPAPTPADKRRSGLLDMGPALQALQRDDAQNPAMLMVQDGAALWARRTGAANRACADCHGPAQAPSARLVGLADKTDPLGVAGQAGIPGMAGVAARYPAIDAASGQPLNLAGRIRQCRRQHQQAPDWPADNPELLALSAHIGLASRGHPITPPEHPRLAALQRQGGQLWQQRLGQLNLSCAQCHDQLAGQRLAGAVIPQGHPTGYPIYRLEWQGLGSLQRRLRACLVGVRAEPFAPDDPQWLALEAYLAKRAAGMPVETPAVRP